MAIKYSYVVFSVLLQLRISSNNQYVLTTIHPNKYKNLYFFNPF